MVRRLRNWSYPEVIDFLKENGFYFLKERGGSHQAWIKRGENAEPDRIVEVNFRHDSYPIGTIKTMIRQSGIDEAEWIKWAGS
jgi:predicted RNA binding protein YcfA (HicA-like mRNA interferase family)